MSTVAGKCYRRVRTERDPFSVIADDRMSIDDLDADVRERGAVPVGVEKQVLCVRDLEDPTLSVIPQKDLDIAVLVSRILGRNIAARFEDNKSSVSADRAGKRIDVGIRKLPQNTIDRLRINGGGEREYKNNYKCEIKAKLHRLLQTTFHEKCRSPPKSQRISIKKWHKTLNFMR